MTSYFGSLLTVAIVILFLALFFSFIPVRLWIAAVSSGVKVGLVALIGM